MRSIGSRLEMMTPQQLLLLLIGVQLSFWTAIPAMTHISLPLDVVGDGLIWGHEWQWGYHKHPPLPSWLTEVSFLALGDTGPFLLSQIVIAMTYVFVFLLAREIVSEEKAIFATMLLSGIYYFSLPTPEFNHNVAQMPIWASFIFFAYKSLHSRHPGWWLALGTVTGFGLLTKYSTLLLPFVMVLLILATPRYRALFRSPGPYLAILVAAAIIAPHVLWLLDHDFLPLRYFEGRAAANGFAGPLIRSFYFMRTQIADHLPVLLLLAAGGLLSRPRGTSLPESVEIGTEDRRFLLYFGLGPAILTCTLSVLSGFAPRDMWGAPMWSMSGLLVLMIIGKRWARLNAGRFYASALALTILGSLGFGGYTLFGSLFDPTLNRLTWPDREIAQRMDANWRLHSNCPMEIVTSDIWLGGLIATRLPARPSVFIDSDMVIAPWITPERLKRAGALFVWFLSDDLSFIPEHFAAMPGFLYGGVEIFDWPRPGRRFEPLKLGWGVIPNGKKC